MVKVIHMVVLILGYSATVTQGQLQLYRNKNFKEQYFGTNYVTTECQNLDDLEVFSPASITTKHCAVLFNGADCLNSSDSFKVTGNVSDVVSALTVQGETTDLIFSYRRCTEEDNYGYIFDHYIAYTYVEKISNASQLNIKKLLIEPICSTLDTPPYFSNVMAMSPICVKLYQTLNCDDDDDYHWYEEEYDRLSNLGQSYITLEPWTAKYVSDFGYVRSIEPCNKSDLYEPHERPKNLPKPDIPKKFLFRQEGGERDQRYFDYTFEDVAFALIGFCFIIGYAWLSWRKPTELLPTTTTSARLSEKTIPVMNCKEYPSKQPEIHQNNVFNVPPPGYKPLGMSDKAPLID